MTSSLVGSEMCIRDSMLGLPETTPRPKWQRTLRHPLKEWQDQLQGLCAVSYTHLTLPTICSV
eukprot:2683570-Prorocentrum_lima.AAC.1